MASFRVQDPAGSPGKPAFQSLAIDSRDREGVYPAINTQGLRTMIGSVRPLRNSAWLVAISPFGTISCRLGSRDR